MPFSANLEPYDEVVGVIEHSFKLRRSDAIPKALRQLCEWNKTIAAMERRKEPTARLIRDCCEKIQTLIKANVGKYSPRDHSGPTAEQAARPPVRDNIQSLEEANRLTAEQVAAAREIQRIVELITSSCHPRGQSFEKGTAAYRPNGLLSAETAYRWSVLYVPWLTALRAAKDKRRKRLARLVILDGVSLDAARRMLKMSYERGHAYLQDSLDLYIEIKETSRDRAERLEAINQAEARA